MTTPTVTAARFPADYGQTPESLAELQSWEEVVERIAAAPNYHLVTVNEDGTPRLRPVDGVFVEGTLTFGGSPSTGWVRNLEARPQATASVPDLGNAVVIEGHAELITDPDDPIAVASTPATVAKYPQYFPDGKVPPFQPFWCLRAHRVYAWPLDGFPRLATRFDFDSDRTS